jgi:uncharacterized MAPEG superfamily protein
MTTELQMLIYSVILGIVHLIAASHFISWQYGYKWTAGNHEEEMPPLTGIAGRVDRGVMNFLETFPFFAAAVLVAHVAGVHNAWTVTGARMYFWGRVAYFLIYAIGIPVARSLAWNVAVMGILAIVLACLGIV